MLRHSVGIPVGPEIQWVASRSHKRRARSAAGGGSDRPLAGGGAGLGRTDEEIQIVFDRHKAALYRMYNRELRKNPTLKGQMVLRMTIEADGSVSLCELKSTNMKSPTLSAQSRSNASRLSTSAPRTASPQITIAYPIDFLAGDVVAM